MVSTFSIYGVDPPPFFVRHLLRPFTDRSKSDFAQGIFFKNMAVKGESLDQGARCLSSLTIERGGMVK